MKLGYAWHTGTIRQKRRRAEINAFKHDPNCRVFLSTDSGGTGLNLQNASVVINCDLPWNPAKLEQRIARAWRKHQTRPVTVINLVTENTIEHGMLETLAIKQGLSDGVLDLRGNLDKIDLKGGSQSFMNRLQVILSTAPETPADTKPRFQPTDRKSSRVNAGRLLGQHLISCEERFAATAEGSTIAVIVERDAASWKPRLEELHQKLFADQPQDEPTRLLVLDRATVDALEALQAAGLIQRSERASRPLDGATPDAAAQPALLSEAEKAEIATLASTLEHRLKIARALGAADLINDALPPLSEALLQAGGILAVTQRLTKPQEHADLRRSPWMQLWPQPARDALDGDAKASYPQAFHSLMAECERVLKLARGA